ncbi:MAG TPA: hypothetical protein VJZ00_23960 [Thermoanaerobaculia bacterium]|nr:hypothetical protein [Thermoanaerobaculia bacterium]
MNPVRALVLLVVATTVAAQDFSSFEKILVPVLNPSQPILGANGSRFDSKFGVLTTAPVAYYPAPGDPPAIGRGEGLLFPLWEAPVIAKGRFLFFEKGAAEAPMFASLSSVDPAGNRAVTPLPIVRERDARTGVSVFGFLHNEVIYGPPSANHPTFAGHRQRHTLRVYDFDSTGNLEVNVRLRWAQWLSQGVIAERRVAVNTRDFDHITYPFYAELNLEQTFGSRWCFPDVYGGCQTFDAIVEVEPTSPAARYYAFISTTDNDTNHVVIHTAR